MKIIDRYLLKAIIPSFLVSFGFILFLLFMSQIFYLAEIFITRRVPFGIVLKILFYLLPSIIALSLPLAFMAGVLGGLARLSSDGEIEAMKVLGLSPWKIFKPVFVLGLVFWLISMSFTFWITPEANYRWLQTMVHSVLSRMNLEIEPGLFVESIPGKVIFIEKRQQDGAWQKVFLYQQEEDNKAQIVLARSGGLVVIPEKKEALLSLENGQLYGLNFATPEILTLNNFQKLEQTVDLQKLAENYSLEKKAREKSIEELWTDWQEVKKKKEAIELFNRRLTLVELNKRFSLPAACLIFVFLGVGLGWKRSSSSRFGTYVLTIALLLFYYSFLVYGEETALKGKLSPWLGMWLPDILIFLVGLGVYYSAFHKEKALIRLKVSNLWEIFVKAFCRKRNDSKNSGKSNNILGPTNSLFPRLLDRYIISRFLQVSVLIFVGLLLILIFINFFQHLELLKETQKPIRLLFLFIWYKMPEFILFTALISILISPALSLSYLYRRNEIQAMITLGVSYFRIILPLILVALALMIPGFFLQDKVISRSNARAEEILNVISDRPVRSFTLISHYWIRSASDGRFYHYDLLEPSKKKLSRLLVLEINKDSSGIKRIIYATEALINPDELKLQSGWVREFKDNVFLFSPFNFSQINLPQAEKYFLKEWKEPANMSLNELKRYSLDLEKTGYKATRFRLEAEFRKAFTFSFLVLVILSLAFVGLFGAQNFIFPLVLSLIGGFLYWETLAIFRSLGIAESLSPWLAAWGPQILFLLAGGYLLLKSRT
jgi:LPS export ABC transporter permease LptF/LPS export ABC transporter permease LptG